MKRLAIVILTVMSAGEVAAQQGGPSWGVGVGGGTMSGCTDVSKEVTNNWFDVKRIMTTDTKMKRPRYSDFYCVSPYYMRDNAMPKAAPGARTLRCFELVDGRGACCDSQMTSCAMLE